MNHRNNWASAKLEIIANPLSGKTQKESTLRINQNFDRGSESKLVVAYDAFSSAHRAWHLFEWLAGKASKILAFIRHFVSFDELAKAYAAEHQPGEAATVDIIAIVAKEHADLRDLAEEWTRRWKTTGRTRRSRLLVLFSTRHQENHYWAQTQLRLPQVAARTGMRFVLQATPMARMPRPVPDTNPKAAQTADEVRRTLRNVCDNSRLLKASSQRAVAVEPIADLQPTVVSKAIIDVMRFRQRKTCPPTIPSAKSRCSPSPEMSRIRVSSNL
jgi:hypothetical protein